MKVLMCLYKVTDLRHRPCRHYVLHITLSPHHHNKRDGGAVIVDFGTMNIDS